MWMYFEINYFTSGKIGIMNLIQPTYCITAESGKVNPNPNGAGFWIYIASECGGTICCPWKKNNQIFQDPKSVATDYKNALKSPVLPKVSRVWGVSIGMYRK